MPKFIERQPRIIWKITFRQFLFLAGVGGALAFLHMTMKSKALFWLIAIIVSAFSDRIKKTFFKQLKVGGKMTIPVKDKLILLTKISETEYETESFTGFFFVPLIKILAHK